MAVTVTVTITAKNNPNPTGGRHGGETTEQYRKRKGISEIDWSEVGPELLGILRRIQRLNEAEERIGHDLLADVDEAITKAGVK